MIFFNYVVGDLVALAITCFAIVIANYKWKYQYWSKRKLPNLKPTIPFGNFNPKKQHIALEAKNLYDVAKDKGWKHVGVYSFQSPIYLVIDLDYLKNIMIKDFEYFTDRGAMHNESDDPLSAHLFHLNGTKWKNLRAKITPTFTSGKMKMMFQTLVDCETNLRMRMASECDKNEPVDIKEILGCFATDTIVSCAFGLDCKSLEEDSPFRRYGKKSFQTTRMEKLKRIIATNFPTLRKILHITLIHSDVSNFFFETVKDTVEYREKNNVTRKDFLQLLIDLKNNKPAEHEGYKHDGQTLTVREIAAQSFVFFIAGFETSSTTMTFALYELAKHQHFQQKLRDEINEVLAKHGNRMTYEAIQDMKYLSQVVDETLRKYPPAPIIPRICVKDYKIPDTDIVIEKGTRVLIPILAIHHDREHYPDPEKFDPERFNEENKASRHNLAHLPFGEGPRSCIGLRFGLMQSKVGLASLLKSYRFTVNNKTQEPLKMMAHSNFFAAEGGVWLNAHKL